MYILKYFFPEESHVFKTNLVDPACECVSKSAIQKENQFESITNIKKNNNSAN